MNDKKLIEHSFKTRKYVALDTEALPVLLEGEKLDTVLKKPGHSFASPTKCPTRGAPHVAVWVLSAEDDSNGYVVVAPEKAPLLSVST